MRAFRPGLRVGVLRWQSERIDSIVRPWCGQKTTTGMRLDPGGRQVGAGCVKAPAAGESVKNRTRARRGVRSGDGPGVDQLTVPTAVLFVFLRRGRACRLGPGTLTLVRPRTGLLPAPLVTGDSTLSTRVPRFFAGPLVRGTFLMGSLASLAGNFTLLGAIHRRKSTIFLGHVVPPRPRFGPARDGPVF